MGANREMEDRTIREAIIAAVNELYQLEWVTAAGGNLSARAAGADKIWITPSGTFKGGLTADDLLCVALNGEIIEGSAKPSIETPMHCAIYRARQDVNAIVHTHAPFATALGLCGLTIPEITPLACVVSDMPLIPYALSGEALSAAVMEVLGNAPGALLQNHGLLSLGADLRQAISRTALVEHVGKVLFYTKTIGCGLEPSPIPEPALGQVRAHVRKTHRCGG